MFVPRGRRALLRAMSLSKQRRVPADTSKLYCKNLFVAASDTAVERFSDFIGRLIDDGDGRTLAMASMCTGSGLGEKIISDTCGTAARVLARSAAPIEVVFGCESKRAKAEWLFNNKFCGIVFKACESMGSDAAEAWFVSGLQTILPAALLSAGFSCKDLSQLSEDQAEMLPYILSVLENYLFTGACTDKEGNPPKGITLPTLLGVIRYVFPSAVLWSQLTA